jgi:hypothetical protein
LHAFAAVLEAQLEACASHEVHVAAAASLNVPPVQVVKHADWSVFTVKPALQAVHFALSARQLLQLPTVHVSHLPAVVLKKPALHVVQLVAEPHAAQFASHVSHLPPAASFHVPAAQVV